MSGLGKRVVTALILATIAFTCLFTSSYLLMMLLLLFVLGGVWEFAVLLQMQEGIAPNRTPLFDKLAVTALGGLVYLLLSGILTGLVPAKYWVVLPPLLFLPVIRELYAKPKGLFVRFSLHLTGILYVSVPCALVNALAIYGTDAGYKPFFILSIFLLIWANDTGAYFAGKLFGKTPLFKSVSPNKTWEGSLGGAFLTLLMAVIIAQFIPVISLTDWLVIAGFSITAGTWGDLAESMFKRNIGVKDSGTLLPGHGGVLDRLDAVFLVIPFVWCWLNLAK